RDLHSFLTRRSADLSARTGTASTPWAVDFVRSTVTGASVKDPAADWSSSTILTVIFAAEFSESLVATVPTEKIVPSTVVPSGSLIRALSPALASDWRLTSRRTD